jgi:hypothetical protein
MGANHEIYLLQNLGNQGISFDSQIIIISGFLRNERNEATKAKTVPK